MARCAARARRLRCATAPATPRTPARSESPRARARGAPAEGRARPRRRSRRDRTSFDHLDDALERLPHRQAIGLDHDRVVSGAQRRDGTRAVELVATKDLREQVRPRPALAACGELLLPAAGTL